MGQLLCLSVEQKQTGVCDTVLLDVSNLVNLPIVAVESLKLSSEIITVLETGS